LQIVANKLQNIGIDLERIGLSWGANFTDV